MLDVAFICGFFGEKKMCYNQDMTNANILFLPLPSYIILAMSLMGCMYVWSCPYDLYLKIFILGKFIEQCIKYCIHKLMVDVAMNTYFL